MIFKTDCKKSRRKKYKTRDSPPYPANKCPNMQKMGNDGRYYHSEKDKNNVYKWKPLVIKSRRKKPSSNNKTKKNKLLFFF
jgi:hypothetical protein